MSSRPFFSKRQSIADYERQRDMLREEEALLEVSLADGRIDDLDVEATIRFGEYVLTNAARLWQAAESSQKANSRGFYFLPVCLLMGTLLEPL